MSNAITPSQKTGYAVYGLSAASGIGGAAYLTATSEKPNWLGIIGCIFLAGVGLFGLSQLKTASANARKIQELKEHNDSIQKTHRLALEKLAEIVRPLSQRLDIDVSPLSGEGLSLEAIISQLSKVSAKVTQLKDSELMNAQTIQELREQIEALAEIDQSPIKDQKLQAALDKLGAFTLNLDESDNSDRSNPNTPTASPIKKMPSSRTGTPGKTQTPSNNLFG
jgi:hypothetical protein